MARYYRRYRRYRRRPYRRYRRRYARRFVNGSSRSQCRVKVPTQYSFDVSVATTGTVYSKPISPFLSGTAGMSAIPSPLYQNYCKLYDEVKCIGAKAIISIGTNVGTTSVPTLTIRTAWDRRHASTDGPPSYTELANYATQQTAVAVNNSVNKLKRSIYASDLMEKAQWHDCTIDDPPLVQDHAYVAAGANPNFFCPALWIGMLQSGSATQTIRVLADVTFYFAFRNPKYGASSESKSVIYSRDPIDAVDIDDIGEIDNDDMIVVDNDVISDSRTAQRVAEHRAKLVDPPGPTLEPPEKPVRRRAVVVTPPKN